MALTYGWTGCVSVETLPASKMCSQMSMIDKIKPSYTRNMSHSTTHYIIVQRPVFLYFDVTHIPHSGCMTALTVHVYAWNHGSISI